MPPYEADRVIWQYVNREVEIREEERTDSKRWLVVVVFTRVGQRAATQERVSEVTGETIVASRLGKNQAEDLKRTVQDVCGQSYAQGHSFARHGV